MRRGDTVVTTGGLVGKVTKVVDDDHIEVEIADGVRVRQMRSMVTEVRAKGEPVKDDSAGIIAPFASPKRASGARSSSRTVRPMLYFTRWKAAAILLTALVVCLFAVPNFFSERDREDLAGLGAAPHRARPRPAGRLAHAAEVDTNDVRKEQLQARRRRRAAGAARGADSVHRPRHPRQHRRGAHHPRHRSRQGADQAARAVAAAGGILGLDRPAHARHHQQRRPGHADRRASRRSSSACARRSISRSRSSSGASTDSAWSSRPSSAKAPTASWSRCPGLQDPQRAQGHSRQDRQARLPHGRSDDDAGAGAATAHPPPDSEILDGRERRADI